MWTEKVYGGIDVAKAEIASDLRRIRQDMHYTQVALDGMISAGHNQIVSCTQYEAHPALLNGRTIISCAGVFWTPAECLLPKTATWMSEPVNAQEFISFLDEHRPGWDRVVTPFSSRHDKAVMEFVLTVLNEL